MIRKSLAIIGCSAFLFVLLTGGMETRHLTPPAYATDKQSDWRSELENFPGGGEGDESEGSGIGGTGYKPVSGDGNGIGGTGKQANENGIGGTGIIGAITGFGSIFVNGYEVEIADDLPIGFKEGQTNADSLAIGQIVEIEATGDGTHVNAASVRVRHELGGAIEKIDRTNNTVTVLGQRVELSATNGANAPPNALKIENLRVGDRVDVSGFRRADGTIEATRLDPLPKGEPDHLIGPLSGAGTSALTVGGLALSAGQTSSLSTLENGAEVRVVGELRGRRFHARRARAHARLRFSNRVRRLAIEGYVRRNRRGDYVVGRYAVRRPAAFRQRLIYTGRLNAQRRFIQGDARPARLLKRRGRRIRAIRRRIWHDMTPAQRRNWQAAPPAARKKWLRQQERKRRMRRRRRRN